MTGMTCLWASERGVFSLLVLLIGSVFLAIGKLTGSEWITVVTIVAGLLVTGKTVTTAIQHVIKRAPPSTDPDASNPPAGSSS